MDYGFLIRSILLQIIIFCSIPFVFWVVKRKKESAFFTYVGLRKSKCLAKPSSVIVFVISYIFVYGVVHFIPFIYELTQPSANSYAGLGVSAIIPAILVCFMQQAFAEEVLFRGFIGKRLSSKFGLNIGNAMQAIIFSCVHVLLSISPDKTIVSYLIIFVSITMGGWLLGYLNEKLFNGSILPSIILHGLGNFITVMLAAF